VLIVLADAGLKLLRSSLRRRARQIPQPA